MIEIRLAPEEQRVLLLLSGDVAGTEFVATILGLLHADATLAGCDLLLDLLRYSGSVGHDDLRRLKGEYAALAGDRDQDRLVVLVTRDRGFLLWAGVMQLQFPHRRFRVVPSLDEALAMQRAAVASRAGPAHSC